MAEAATAAGLALAILPLIVTAFENYEYTFQPIMIFSQKRRYRKEVERFQNGLKVQKVDFENECCFLLHSVTSNRGNFMINDLENVMWRDLDLERRLKARLDCSYDACVSVLTLINDILTDIVEETKSLEVLMQRKEHEQIDLAWLHRLRQRSKISFSKPRFDQQLRELENHIDGLHRLRKHVEHIRSAEKQPTSALKKDSDISIISRATHCRVVQMASARLHEVLSSSWQCEAPGQHFANICLNHDDDKTVQDEMNIYFDLAWTCPLQLEPREQSRNPTKLLIQAASGSIPPAVATSQTHDLEQRLEMALEISIGATIAPAASNTPTDGIKSQLGSTLTSNLDTASTSLLDLCTIPNLCHHLRRQEPSATSIRCAGFFRKTGTFIYTPGDRTSQTPKITTLEDALKAASMKCSGMPDFNLASLLSLAVLQFHSTPWLNDEWRSQDVVFFHAEDQSRVPFLKSPFSTQTNSENRKPAPAPGNSRLRSPARNKTLYSLGVVLLELAYNAQLQDLREPEDDQGDPHTLYWAAVRLGHRVQRDLGPNYADAVNICLHAGFGPSSQLEDPKVQLAFLDEVVRKIEKCAEAIRILTSA